MYFKYVFQLLVFQLLHNTACDFLLAFHSNYGPISYHFRESGRYLQEKKFTPIVFNAPFEWVIFGIL